MLKTLVIPSVRKTDRTFIFTCYIFFSYCSSWKRVISQTPFIEKFRKIDFDI